ncbi:unnamed protein product [Nippostrongylus brasiliensis]|uniref:Uncharacterized protein n=1 Tax=Nippostrongylus brasiliensis TaxID=27835 RepID=A0A0N4XZB1_NIPBR|nr:unnamed protein product [Nippostrongylus brasiliensis]
MNRISEIETILHRLVLIDETSLIVNSDWNDVADDIVRSISSMTSIDDIFVILDKMGKDVSTSLYDVCGVRVTSLLFAEIATSCSDVSYESAANAFNREIFSRCVQIVEAADKKGHIELQMISLAHHSYIAMVNEADRTEDALKLAKWWNKFLEGVERGRPNNEMLEILEMRATALESLIDLDDNNRDAHVQKLADVLIRSYKMSCIVNRHFNSRTLRRLELIADWLEEYKHGDDHDVSEVQNLLQDGIDEAFVDRHHYEVETEVNLRQRRDLNYIMCCEILRSLCQRSSPAPSITSYDVTKENGRTASSLEDRKSWAASPEVLESDDDCRSPSSDVVIRF